MTKEEQERFALEEIQNSKESSSLLHPNIHWIGMLSGRHLFSFSSHWQCVQQAEYRIYDLAFGVVGIALWLWVSMLWKDRYIDSSKWCFTVYVNDRSFQ